MDDSRSVTSPNLTEYLMQRKGIVEQALVARLPCGDSEPKRVHEAMRYATMGLAKRLRPILALAVGEFAGQAPEGILDTACAIEFMHTASLVLDDLPSMDNATERRGRSCTHEVFGEATAILAAFGLITLAFDLVARNAASCQGAAADSSGRAVCLLARATGTGGLIGGQHADLILAGRKETRAQLERAYELKAGALFLAAVQIPALFLGLPSSEVEALENYARKLGLAFQITDDLIDAEEQGKEAAKPTLPAYLGIEGARREVANLIVEAVQAFEPSCERAEPLRVLAEYVQTRTS